MTNAPNDATLVTLTMRDIATLIGVGVTVVASVWGICGRIETSIARLEVRVQQLETTLSEVSEIRPKTAVSRPLQGTSVSASE